MQNSGTKANLNKSYWEVTISIQKVVRFGQAVYVCGSMPELGMWEPQHSLRLIWTQGHRWEGSLMIAKGTIRSLEFKFLVSSWNILANSNIIWQLGNFNRRLDLLYAQDTFSYNAEWNREKITVCLHTHPSEDSTANYYISGSLSKLGLWKDKKLMRLLDKPLREALTLYFNNDVEYSSQARIVCYSFSVGRQVEWFNYFYVRVGDTVQSETYPGRVLKLQSKRFQNGRINELDWMGSRLVLDQTSFDQLIFERMSNLIYFACHLKSTSHFHKLIEKNITAILNLSSQEEDFAIPNYHIKTLCKDNGVLLQNWTIQDLSGPKFIKEAEDIVKIVQNMLMVGHRVCIHCSRKVMRSNPINLLYLTLFVGYSFGEALQIVSRDNNLSEASCRSVQDVYNLVGTKLLRGRTTIQMN